ncbi:hypothetical protein Pmani_021376 [Petrolisthes manimaculis]|uniref:Uncharacterized protein n=1 Tax=Petrolisthes manimaculis TaxID=1843537 RepID=A0AAE1U277_9EUCA|nr:hypothetical protein Pmani_021376 [Petrolisthes manimaculis]
MKDSEEFFQVMTSCVEVKTDIERDTSDTPYYTPPYYITPYYITHHTTNPFHPTPPPTAHNNPLPPHPTHPTTTTLLLSHLTSLPSKTPFTTPPQPMPDTPYTSSSASPPLAKILHQEPI